MKVGIIGSGGREHAICVSLKKSKDVSDLFCFPGNAGTSLIAKNIDIDIINKPTNSAIRFIQKTAILLTYSFIRITNQICHFVSLYYCC